MDQAEQFESRIASIIEKREADREWTREAILAARNGSSELWEDLFDYIEKETKKLPKMNKLLASFPCVKEISALLDGNGITVMTGAFPKIKLHITCTDSKYIRGFVERMPNSFDIKTAYTAKYRFAADGELRPCFSKDGECLHPKEVAELLMQEVYSFFEELIQKDIVYA